MIFQKSQLSYKYEWSLYDHSTKHDGNYDDKIYSWKEGNVIWAMLIKILVDQNQEQILNSQAAYIWTVAFDVWIKNHRMCFLVSQTTYF